MKRLVFTLALALLVRGVAAAQSQPAVQPAPYARLAKDLGTPDLISSAGPADKSLLKLRFVASGQSDANWVKMTSISIAKVRPADTLVASRDIIAKFKSSLEAQKHAKITTFDQSKSGPSNAYFEFVTASGIAGQGIAYSPTAGFVSVIQVAYKHGYVHAASDRAMLESVIRGR